QAPLFSPSPGWLKYSFLLLAHVAQVFIPISGSNIGSHLAQIFVDIHKVVHMDAGGRKWCAQRQQSRIMQMLGNKLPVKHKKETILQSLPTPG
ncbi:MAG: hypothetical protein UE029_09635, partial [Christensenellales bacterium]|nr:hypothetical protein [Christensenellales bacterium]